MRGGVSGDETSLPSSRMIQARIYRADAFCADSAKTKLREPFPEFFLPPADPLTPNTKH